MSVINQMLRDLEQRKATEPVSEHYIDEVNIIAKNSFNYWWIILPISIVLVVGINLSLHSSNKMNSNDVSENSKIVKKIVFPDLPSHIAELKLTPAKAQYDDVQNKNDSAQVIKTSTQVQSIAKDESKKEKTVENKIEKKKQAKTIVKKEKPETKVLKPKVLKPKVQKTIASENMPKEKTSVVKVKLPVRSPIKSTNNNKSSEQVVYEASQLMTSNQKGAIQLLEKNLKLVSPDMDYYSLLANLQQRQHRYDDAIIYYRKALEIASYKGELWVGIALAYRGTGEEDNALKAFNQAVISEEISSELRFYAAQQLEHQ